MINPTRVAVAVCAALLWTPLFDGGLDPAVAGQIAASTEAAAAPAVQPTAAPRGRAYLFRGALGPFFSRGMDRLTERIEQAGISANVFEFTVCRLIADRAIGEYRESPAPIILIGHSMGGFCAVKFAEILEAEGIRASLVVAIDPAHVTPDVPLNVDRFFNIFLSKDVLGGGDVKPRPGFKGHYASYDLSQHDEVSHINIEKMKAVHEQLVTKIVQLTAVKAEGEPVPIRYVVPPDTPIELWDSGMPVFARPGETLQSIAVAYHVPLWSLTQINKAAERTLLIPGERVVVPRHLEPLVEVSGQVPSRH
ncbi:MAG TPA: LysM peptidoglycan-binding domain-containing protein [Bradyrhizobium sp.]|nr:LysM peptidoglycan-binding domain-containing protein [Bradyrhizobium sp.]